MCHLELVRRLSRLAAAAIAPTKSPDRRCARASVSRACHPSRGFSVSNASDLAVDACSIASAKLPSTRADRAIIVWASMSSSLSCSDWAIGSRRLFCTYASRKFPSSRYAKPTASRQSETSRSKPSSSAMASASFAVASDASQSSSVDFAPRRDMNDLAASRSTFSRVRFPSTMASPRAMSPSRSGCFASHLVQSSAMYAMTVATSSLLGSRASRMFSARSYAVRAASFSPR